MDAPHPFLILRPMDLVHLAVSELYPFIINSDLVSQMFL